MSVKKVYVFKTDGLPVYKVYPPVTILKKNDSMVLVNCADKDARWQVPAGVLEDKAIDETVVHGKSRSKKAQKIGPIVAAYSVIVGRSSAHGNSDPVIIIDE